MASGQVIKRVKYKTSLKDPGTPGRLTLNMKLAFKPNNPNSASKLDMEFQYITRKSLSKPGETPKPTDTNASPSEQPSMEELHLRIKLMQENSELQKLHKQFVSAGVLTDTEFWAARKKLLNGEFSRKSKQRVGIKSAMLSDSKPLIDGRVQCSFSFSVHEHYVSEV